MTARLCRFFRLLFTSLGAIASAQITEEPPDDPPGEVPDVTVPDFLPDFPPLPAILKHSPDESELGLTFSLFQAVASGETGTWLKSTDLENWSELEPPSARDGPYVELIYTVVPGETVYIRWRSDETP